MDGNGWYTPFYVQATSTSQRKNIAALLPRVRYLTKVEVRK